MNLQGNEAKGFHGLCQSVVRVCEVRGGEDHHDKPKVRENEVEHENPSSKGSEEKGEDEEGDSQDGLPMVSIPVQRLQDPRHVEIPSLSGQTHNNFLVDDVITVVAIVLRDPVRHDAHDDDGRNPNDSIAGEHQGREPDTGPCSRHGWWWEVMLDLTMVLKNKN